MPLAVLDVCVPIADKVGIPLAMENHKDRVVDEEVEVLKKYSSANFGALVDFGNNISMCDDPVDVITKLAPYVKSCHMKNMAVQNYRRRLPAVGSSVRGRLPGYSGAVGGAEEVQSQIAAHA